MKPAEPAQRPADCKPARGTLLLATLCLLPALPAQAELRTVDVTFQSFLGFPLGSIPSVAASARLDFTINIEQMVFLRVGAGGSHSGIASGSGPAASASVSTVALNLVPSVAPAGTLTLAGSNQATNWGGATPTWAASAPVAIPVEVRSNAGTVRLSGQASTPLSSGSHTIGMSSIVITSSDAANLPAPTVPDSGAGPQVTVATGGTGTGAAPARLTYRQANWSFGFAAGATPPPGTYNGAITFTASTL